MLVDKGFPNDDFFRVMRVRERCEATRQGGGGRWGREERGRRGRKRRKERGEKERKEGGRGKGKEGGGKEKILWIFNIFSKFRKKGGIFLITKMEKGGWEASEGGSLPSQPPKAAEKIIIEENPPAA